MRPLRITPGLLTSMGACDDQKRRFLRYYANNEITRDNLRLWANEHYSVTWFIMALFRLARAYQAMSAELKIEVARNVIHLNYAETIRNSETYWRYQERAALAFADWLETETGQQFIRSAQNKLAHTGL